MQSKIGQQGNEHCDEERGALPFSSPLFSVEQPLPHRSSSFETAAAAAVKRGKKSVKIKINTTVVATVLLTFIVDIYSPPFLIYSKPY